jgi:hypothetical protein
MEKPPDIIAALENDTAAVAQYVGYVSDPNGRGTASLVINCFVTMLLCVWSALHLNVPSRSQTTLQKFWLNVRWIATGIWAPELVVFVAWRQWASARILQGIVKAATADPDSSTGRPRRLKWTLAHGFFASTGGFGLELDSLRTAIPAETGGKNDEVQRLSLTARGVALLAKTGNLPEVDAEEIEDKSKANELAKATVLVQAIWMLAQVIARLGFRLPVTLLEVNTVAHVSVLPCVPLDQTPS